MAFKRTHSVNGAQDLYTKVLVRCRNCGTRDEVASDDDTELEKGNGDTFHNDTDISVHDDCQVCGENAWEEYKEHLVLGTPTQLTPESYRIHSIDKLIEQIGEFQSKLQVARDEGFAVKTVTTEGTVVLVKGLI